MCVKSVGWLCGFDGFSMSCDVCLGRRSFPTLHCVLKGEFPERLWTGEINQRVMKGGEWEGGLTAGARRVVHTLRVIYNMRDVLINELSQRQLLNILTSPLLLLRLVGQSWPEPQSE